MADVSEFWLPFLPMQEQILRVFGHQRALPAPWGTCRRWRQWMALLTVAVLLGACGRPSTGTPPPSEDANAPDTSAIFSWNTELCSYQGTYDPRKYSAEQLQNSYDLWYRFSGVALETSGTASKLEDVPKLDMDRLVAAYQTRKVYFALHEVVPSEYWQNLKRSKVQELEDEFELKKITIQSYSDPSVLRGNRFSSSCPDFVRVLNSSDTAELMRFWIDFSEEQCRRNSAPDLCKQEFEDWNDSPQRLEYARWYLITYGWYNCANGTLARVKSDGQMEDEFKRLFSNVQRECDEP